MYLLTNSCNLELKKRIGGTFYSLEEMDQWGINFIKIDLDEMFVMRNLIISGLHKYLKNFASNGLSKTRGENFIKITAQLVAVS